MHGCAGYGLCIIKPVLRICREAGSRLSQSLGRGFPSSKRNKADEVQSDDCCSEYVGCLNVADLVNEIADNDHGQTYREIGLDVKGRKQTSALIDFRKRYQIFGRSKKAGPQPDTA